MQYQQLSRHNPKSASSLLQLMINLLSKHLSLQPRQAATLFAQDCRYLGYLLIKGKKGTSSHSSKSSNPEFSPLISFLKELSSINFEDLHDGSENIKLLSNLLKHCLQSKSEEVVGEGIAIIKQMRRAMGLGSISTNEGEDVRAQGEGLVNFSKEVVACFRKHIGFSGKLAEIVTLKEMREGLPDRQYLELLQGIVDVVDKQIILNSLSVVLKEIDSMVQKDNIAVCELALAFISKIARTLIDKLEMHMDVILKILKITSRKEWITIKHLSNIVCFELLQSFAVRKSPYAGSLFKKIIFTFIQTHSLLPLRSFLSENFIVVLQSFPTIPSNLLAQPLLKQLQMSLDITYILNVSDISLIDSLINHQQMSLWSELFDFAVRIAVGGGVFSAVAIGWISRVIQKWEEAGSREGSMLVEVYRTMRGGKGKGHAYRKEVVVRIIKEMLVNGSQEVKDTLKAGLVELYHEQDAESNKTIYKLLEIVGVPEVIAREQKTPQIHSQQQSQQAKIRALMETDDYLDSIIKVRKRKFTLQRKNHSSFINNIKNQMQIDPIQAQTSLGIQKSKQKFQQLSLRKKKISQMRIGASASPRQKKASRKQLSLTSINPSTPTTKQLAKTTPVPSFVLIKIQEQQQQDQKSLENCLTKNSKLLEHIWRSYSSKSQATPNPHAHPITSLSLPDKKHLSIISFVDCVRMLSGWSISKSILGDVILQINRGQNQLQNPLIGVTQNGYKDLLVQFAHLVNLRNKQFIPIGVRIEDIIKKISQSGDIKTNAIDLEAEKITKQLQNNEELAIPTEFKKELIEVTEVKHSFTENVTEYWCSSSSGGQSHLSSFLVCYSVVDQLLKSCFNSHVIEPCTHFSTHDIVVRKRLLQNRSAMQSLSHRRTVSLQPLQASSPVESPQQASPPFNSFLKSIQQKNIFSLELQSQKEAKRLKHMEYLKGKLQEGKEEFMRKKEEEAKRKEEEEAEKKQRKKEQFDNRRRFLKEKVEESHQMKKQKLTLEKETQVLEKEKSKEKIKEFLIREKKRQREEKQRKQRETEEKQQRQKRHQQLKRQKQMQLKVRLAEIRQQSIQVLKTHQNLKQKIVQFMKSTPISKFLRSVFKHYQLKNTQFRLQNSDPTALSLPASPDGKVIKTPLALPITRLPIKVFSHFLSDFKICPTIVSIKDALQIFNSTLTGGEAGFREMCLMIGVKGKKGLNVDKAMEERKKQLEETQIKQEISDEINQFKHLQDKKKSQEDRDLREMIKIVSEKFMNYLESQKVTLASK